MPFHVSIEQKETKKKKKKKKRAAPHRRLFVVIAVAVAVMEEFNGECSWPVHVSASVSARRWQQQ